MDAECGPGPRSDGSSDCMRCPPRPTGLVRWEGPNPNRFPPREWGHRSSNEQRPRDVRLRIERHIRENAQDSPRASNGAYFFAIHASPASSTRKPTLPRHRRGRGKACAGVRSVQNAVRTLLPPGCGPRRSSFTVATVEQPLQGQPSPPQIRQISCGPLGLSDCSQTDCRRHRSRISHTTPRRWQPC